MTKKALCLCTVMCLLLNITSCTLSETKDNDISVENTTNISFTKADEAAVPRTMEVGDYAIREIAPLKKDGKTVALVTLNQIQKLGIYDWSSAKALDSGIKHSYTLNFKVTNLTKLANGEIMTYYLSPKFISSKGKLVGNPCIVGWSGFAETAVFDHDTSETYVEYGVQPLRKSLKGTHLILDITDSDGNIYDSICYSKSIFKKIKEGPGIRRSNEAVSVTGASGAVYKISISDVFLEQCFTKHYEFRFDSDVDEVETVPTLMFNYRVEYVKKPKKKLEVSNLIPSKSGTLLSTDLKIGAQSNVDEDIYYDRRTSLCRFMYSDSNKLEAFSGKKRYKIHQGTFAYYTENRLVSNSFYSSTAAVRFRVELNSDALSMKPEELMKFNGRFIVFERVPGTRKPNKKKSKERPYASYTSDTKHE